MWDSSARVFPDAFLQTTALWIDCQLPNARAPQNRWRFSTFLAKEICRQLPITCPLKYQFISEAQVRGAWVIMWKTIPRITEDELMDIDCIKIKFDQLNLYYHSHTPAAAVSRGHHMHIADLSNLSYTWMRGQAENQTGISYISTKWLCCQVCCSLHVEGSRASRHLGALAFCLGPTHALVWVIVTRHGFSG